MFEHTCMCSCRHLVDGSSIVGRTQAVRATSVSQVPIAQCIKVPSSSTIYCRSHEEASSYSRIGSVGPLHPIMQR